MPRINPEKFKYTDFLPGISAKFTINTLSEVLVKATGNSNIKLKGWQVGGENKKGDSYLSTIFKINIVGYEERDVDNPKNFEIHVPVLIKSLPSNIGRRKTYRSTDFFRNEVAFYNEVWPKLLQFQVEKHSGNPFLDVPACYAALADGENDFVALEDMTPQGYGAAKRQNGLDYDHCLLIIQLFARFHSLSFAYKHQYPEEYKTLILNLEETYFSENLRPWYEKYYNNLIMIWLDALDKEIPESVYEKKFKHLVANDFLGQIIDIAGKKGPLSVISQGDAWVPNFLLRYGDDSKPESAKMIDFQLARVSSPALDLSFFFYTCTEQIMREAHWDDLLDEYCKIFQQSLADLGTDPNLFSKEALYEDFKENGRFGLGMAIEALPLSLMEDNETVDLDAIQGCEAVEISEILEVHPIKRKDNRQRLIEVIKHAVDKGFI